MERARAPSWIACVLALFCSHDASGQQQRQAAPRTLPENFLIWPFSPGEEWRITNTYPHGRNIPYALDFQRVGSPIQEARALTSQSVVRAAAPGTVIHAGPLGEYGNAVILRHDNDFVTLYGHLSTVTVSASPNARVHALGQLGIAGNTGTSTGAHIHLEVRDMQGVRRWQDAAFVKPEPILGRRDFATARGQRVSYTLQDVQPQIHDMVRDIASGMQRVFGTPVAGLIRPPGTPPFSLARVPPPQPTPPRELPVLPGPKSEPVSQQGTPDVSKGTVETMGPFRFVIPKGWGIAERHPAGRLPGLTLGPAGVKSWPRYITFLEHPGFAIAANTPEGINQAIQRSTTRRGTTAAVKVGKEKYSGLWFSDGHGGYVLFSPGGSVYILGYGFSDDTGVLQEVLRSIELKP